MRVYLSGMMRRDPDHYRKFKQAESLLTSMGHEVYNPADHPEPGAATQRVYARRDLLKILDWAEAVAVLPTWTGSAGAKAEVATAVWVQDLPILDAMSGEVIHVEIRGRTRESTGQRKTIVQVGDFDFDNPYRID